jgi:hypothetical protein
VNQFDEQKALDPHGVIPRIASGQMKFLRQSMMGSADVCLRRLGYDLLGHKGTGEARIVGTAYHAGLEALYLARRDGRPDPSKRQLHTAAEESFELEAEGHEVWATTKADAMRRVLDMVDAYLDGDHAWSPDVQVLGVEQEWFLPLTPEWAIKGTIDLVLWAPIPGTERWGVVLEDHKTAGRKWPKDKHSPRKQPQPGLYAWAWWSCTGTQPDRFTYGVMTYKGEFERRWTMPTRAHMEALLGKAVGLTRILDGVDPEALPANPTSNLCSAQWCDHWLRCPFGQALELLAA